MRTTPPLTLTVSCRTGAGRARARKEEAFVVADLTAVSPRCNMNAPLTIDVGERGVLVAVSDGTRGNQAGGAAIDVELQALRRALRCRSTSSPDDVEAELCSTVQKANGRAWKAARSARGGNEATLTAVLFHGTQAYVAEIGSHRAYILRGDRFTQLTRDRSHVQALQDLEALARSQAGTREYASALMQAIEARPMVAIASSRVAMSHDDRYLLCSTGLSDKLRDEEMHGILSAAKSMDAACATLMRAANDRGGDDDITAIAVSIERKGDPVEA